MMVLITVSLVVVQEMAARMGAVTGKGLAELIREQYGIRWSVFATASRADREPRHLHLGLRRHRRGARARARPGAGLGADRRGRHLAAHRARLLPLAERIFIWMTIPFFAYPIAAILAHPHWGEVGQAIVEPHIQLNSRATCSCSSRPPGRRSRRSCSSTCSRRSSSAASARRSCRGEQREVGRGVDLREPRRRLHHHRDRRDALSCTAIHDIDSAAEAAKALEPFAGRFAEALFGVGLLGASLLAAAILPVTAAYVIAETLGFEKGIGRRPREAPVFVGVITALDRDRRRSSR